MSTSHTWSQKRILTEAFIISQSKSEEALSPGQEWGGDDCPDKVEFHKFASKIQDRLDKSDGSISGAGFPCAEIPSFSSPKIKKAKNETFDEDSQIVVSHLLKLVMVVVLFICLVGKDALLEQSSFQSTSLADEAADKLTEFVKNHHLFQSDYLKHFSTMSFANERDAIQQFATEHYLYSRNFQQYLANVLNNIEDKESMQLIDENMSEENGIYSAEDLEVMAVNGVRSEWFDRVPHPKLMRRFLREAKADSEYNEGMARSFVDIMLELSGKDACTGLAVMAFAIEQTVSTLYQSIWDGLKLTTMPEETYAFFPLHILIDDGHADALKTAWKKSFNEDPISCYHSSYDAVKTILDARASWYDNLDKQQPLKFEETKEGKLNLITEDMNDNTFKLDSSSYKERLSAIENQLGNMMKVFDEGMQDLEAKMIKRLGESQEVDTDFTEPVDIRESVKEQHQCCELNTIQKDGLVHTRDAQKLYDDQSSSWIRTSPSSLSDFTARSRVMKLLGNLEGKTILDLGCGEGYVSRMMMQHGAKKVYGLDLSPEMIARAKERDQIDNYGIEYHAVNALSASAFMAGIQVDIVVSVFLFNYMGIEDMETVMSGVQHLLKPGGRFIFTTPHPLLPYVRREKKEIFWYEAPKGNYLESVDEFLSGRIEKHDGTALHVQSHHKTFQDYFTSLHKTNLGENVRLFEYGVTEELMATFPEKRDWLSRIQGVPLHAAFECYKPADVAAIPTKSMPSMMNPKDSISVQQWRSWPATAKVSDFFLDVSPAVKEFLGYEDQLISTDLNAFHTKNALFLEKTAELAGKAKSYLLNHGMVLCQGMTGLSKTQMSLFYTIFSAFLSNDSFLEKRGRLYDVIDRSLPGGIAGEDVLVSSTNEPCGFHADSTAKDFNPTVVGLLSLQKCKYGGGELQIVNAQNAYLRLKEVLKDDESIFDALHRPVIRDVILNGTQKNAAAKPKNLIRENAFPIFTLDAGEPHVRYMRYWIETGHTRSATHLDSDLKSAMDVLDTVLMFDDLVPRLKHTLQDGEFVFLDNRIMLHRRTGFSDPERHQQRVWLKI